MSASLMNSSTSSLVSIAPSIQATFTICSSCYKDNYDDDHLLQLLHVNVSVLISVKDLERLPQVGLLVCFISLRLHHPQKLLKVNRPVPVDVHLHHLKSHCWVNFVQAEILQFSLKRREGRSFWWWIPKPGAHPQWGSGPSSASLLTAPSLRSSRSHPVDSAWLKSSYRNLYNC